VSPLYKYRPYQPGGGGIGFLVEYVYSHRHSVVGHRVWRRRRFRVLQACNPPDVFWPLGILFRIVGGSRFVFDHHDLCPELYESRFPGGARMPYWGLRVLEWCTFRSADHVISTNESSAKSPSGEARSEPTSNVVRTGPDADKLRRESAEPQLRRGRRFLVAYLGVMGPQDGVDIVVRAAATSSTTGTEGHQLHAHRRGGLFR